MTAPPATRSAAPRRTAARALAATAGALLASLLVLAGCGIASDDTAREIPRDALPLTLQNDTTSTTTVTGTSRDETLFLGKTAGTGNAEMLEEVETTVDAPDDPNDLPRVLVEALVLTRTDDLERSDLINAVPPGLEVLRAERTADGVLELDLDGLDTVEGSLQRTAVAQLVFTLTELDGISAVRFFEDGEPVAVPVESGSAPAGTAVRRTDDPQILAALRDAATTTTLD